MRICYRSILVGRLHLLDVVKCVSKHKSHLHLDSVRKMWATLRRLVLHCQNFCWLIKANEFLYIQGRADNRMTRSCNGIYAHDKRFWRAHTENNIICSLIVAAKWLLTIFCTQTLSPIPVQAWDAKAHEEGDSRVIHLDLSADLSKFSTEFGSWTPSSLVYCQSV